MPRPQVKSFATPDDLRTMPLVSFATVNLGEAHVGYCSFAPGWRWSESMGPLFGVASCPVRHIGYTISGAIRLQMDDGQMVDIGPGTAFDIPAGHDKWVLGDEPWVTVEWGGSGRAMGEALNENPDRRLATVLFTDIVGSTERLRDVGDASWRGLLGAHNAKMREQLNIFRGTEVKTTGDGLLAIFDSPARAVRAALAMSMASTAMQMPIRAAVHTGEIDTVGEDVRGTAVHVAARVLGLAGPGEVLMTSTTADLLEGSNLRAEAAGMHELKGLAGARPVFRLVRDQAGDSGGGA
jgi:class 3 adenylate cyclase